MRKLILATNNSHKANEISIILGNSFEIISMKDAGINIDIPEPHETLEENAHEKATTINSITGMDCFAEDTGLLIDALNGAPGVKSARYAGQHGNDDANIQKVLNEMKHMQNRKAHFKTVVSLIIEGQNHFFEGICEGTIAEKPTGENGFGYDPIFIPKDHSKSFAELKIEEKTKISHRKIAIEKMACFLKSL